MKFFRNGIWAAFSSLLMISLAQASVTVSTEMSVDAHGFKSGSKRHVNVSTSCLNVSKRSESYGPERTSTSTSNGNGNYTESSNVGYRVVLPFGGGADYVARQLNFNYVKKSELSGSVTISDNLRWRDEKSNNGTCHRGIHEVRLDKTSVNGSLKIKFTMPKDTWAILTKVKMSGDFQINRVTGFPGSLRVGVPLENYIIVWGQPGSVVELAFQFKQYSKGAPMTGEVNWDFEVLGSNVAGPLKLKRVKEVLDDAQQDAQQTFIAAAHLGKLLNNPSELQELLIVEKQIEIYETIKQLSKIALVVDTHENTWDLKSAALLLAMKMATSILKDLGPFCEIETLPAVLSDKPMQVKGVRLAWFYISKAQARIKYYKFDHFRAMLEQLLGYEKQGRTGAEIMKDKNELDRVKKAYKVLTSMNLSKLPFRYSYEEIQFIFQRFNTIGSTPQSTNELLNALNVLAGLERQFVVDFLERLDMIDPKNNAKIVASDLKERLDFITEQQSRASYILENQVSFLSIREQKEGVSSGEDFEDIVTKFISENVNVLTKPFENSQFEGLRKSFVEHYPVESVLNQVLKCK